MVIKMEGIYVCRMKYPMFLLILKLSESLGYEPVRRKDGVIVQQCKHISGKEERRGKTLQQLQSSKVCTLTTRTVVISPFFQMEHLISPKRWIPFQGQVRFQLNMAESSKHGRFFCNPLSQQAAPAFLRELSQRAALPFFLHFLCPLNITKRAFQRCIIATHAFTLTEEGKQAVCSCKSGQLSLHALQENISWLCQDINWSSDSL